VLLLKTIITENSFLLNYAIASSLPITLNKVNFLSNLMWIIKPMQVNVFDLGSINCKTKRFGYNSLLFMSLSLAKVPKVGHLTSQNKPIFKK